MKQSRYYEIIDGVAYVYDTGWKQYSVSVSIVNIADLKYYRNNFNLEKVWTK